MALADFDAGDCRGVQGFPAVFLCQSSQGRQEPQGAEEERSKPRESSLIAENMGAGVLGLDGGEEPSAAQAVTCELEHAAAQPTSAKEPNSRISELLITAN